MRIIFVFYRNFLTASLAISFTIGAFTHGGSVSVVLAASWAKLFTSAMLGLFFWIFRSDQFYFFENLGFTKQRLFAGALAVDLVLWVIIAGFIRVVS